MAKGHLSNQERLATLNSFGKDLARRAKSKCELSGQSGVPLKIYEIPPVKEPEFDKCLLVCDEVHEQLERPKSLTPDSWRHLAELIWEEEPAIQVMCIRILTHISKTHAWAHEILESFDTTDEISEWADQAPLS